MGAARGEEVAAARPALRAALPRAIAALGLAAALAALGAHLLERSGAPRGLRLEAVAFSGARVQRTLAAAALPARLDGPGGGDLRRARLTGYWFVDGDGCCHLRLVASGRAALRLDGADVVLKQSGPRAASVHVPIAPGAHRLELEYEPQGEPALLRLLRGIAPDALAPLPAETLFLERPDAAGLERAAWAGRLRTVALGSAAACLGLLMLLAARARGRPLPAARSLPAALLALVVLYGGALRFEALVTRYWEAQGAPVWALDARDAILGLRPGSIRWSREAHPYRGDPGSYLRVAREERGFFDAHVREPLFVETARLFLWAAGDRDIGLNLASAFFGTGLVAATGLLAARMVSPLAGVAAALALAVERQAIGLSVEGWRDDAFACFVALSAWALLRLLDRPGRGAAILAGLACAAAVLTRLSGLSFVLPAVLYLLVAGGGDRPARRRCLGLAVAVAALLVGPYLLACFLAFGDPFHAVNYHTAFYRTRSGLPAEQPMGWTSFLMQGRGPMELIDTGLLGLTWFPFSTKWYGFAEMSPAFGQAFQATAAAGLFLLATTWRGGLLVVVLLSSLLPYAITWTIVGGAEWRFTLHASAIYLAAAGCAAVVALRLARALASVDRPALRDCGRTAGIAAALALSLLLAMSLALYLRVAEDVERGNAALVAAGPRDWLLVGPGWSWPRERERQEARVAERGQGTVWLPVRTPRDLTVELRASALVREGAGAAVLVRLNGAPIAALAAPPEGDRAGRLFRLPAAALRAGRNRIEIGSAGGAPVVFWSLEVDGRRPWRPPNVPADE